ncbi:Solute carrier family 35 member F6 [Trichinella pseudospiralis]|uniref:Solute carrier family 35 member F6 n=1 Tax=Trichinella pseudospiralis TaxID=6337 RepID=A0A0V1JH50_TRIPS|nr:Solute carrier family 35 member F6 [Trichinella pseudospiralis]
MDAEPLLVSTIPESDLPAMADSENGWTKYQIFLAFLMVITGTLNTLAAKWADMMYGLGRPFNHPFFQAFLMFVGEFACLPAFFLIEHCWKRKKCSRSLEVTSDNDELVDKQKFNFLIFLPATLCDMTATSIMYIGLTMTNASSFQMLRGATVIFTGIFSVAFLGMTLAAFKWIGMFLVLCGLIVVGVSDMMFSSNSAEISDPNRMISGDLLIVIAQIVIALQMVYEQKFISKYNVAPMLAVGLEGIFGVILMAVVCICFYWIKVPSTFSTDPDGRLENVLDAVHQIEDNMLILIPIIGLIVSIAFFNFAGISVTKEMNATTRMVLDSVRVFFIWGVSLIAGWQSFVLLQLGGFAILLIGMFVYNNIFFHPVYLKLKEKWHHSAPATDNSIA